MHEKIRNHRHSFRQREEATTTSTTSLPPSNSFTINPYPNTASTVHNATIPFHSTTYCPLSNTSPPPTSNHQTTQPPTAPSQTTTFDTTNPTWTIRLAHSSKLLPQVTAQPSVKPLPKYWLPRFDHHISKFALFYTTHSTFELKHFTTPENSLSYILPYVGRI